MQSLWKAGFIVTFVPNPYIRSKRALQVTFAFGSFREEKLKSSNKDGKQAA